ncbi:TonB-dependent receptor plug domain-containing protein [Pendulispora albinea]|uniref:TonB-dependent receptor plug domain-containing protein n=1 Tax=Pendulispora albinea TaxID=2741071 RepID=A0ABZ2M6R9_9BACT
MKPILFALTSVLGLAWAGGALAQEKTSDVVEVKVKGAPTTAQKMQQSAQAVTVVDMRRAQQQSADLGEVLARTQGVAVQRLGGLGANTDVSLNGCIQEQLRYFLDGVPLEYAGFPFGIANVPINFVRHLEIYRGVLPARFGADALCGGINAVTDERRDTRLRASYQVGSFGTQRITLDGRYRDRESGFIAGASVYFDYAKNNYPVDVTVADPRGRTQDVSVRRFHDRYHSVGGFAEVGVIDRPWARLLLLKAFASTYDKELQNNIVMTVPYGETRYGETLYGATVRYEQPLARNLELKATANVSRRTIDFVDDSGWVYDWYGRRTTRRFPAGEIENVPHDQTFWQNNVYGNAVLSWKVHPSHILHLAVTPQATFRTGEERERDKGLPIDPQSGDQRLVRIVTGAEYESHWFGDRVENIVLAKDYVMQVDGEVAATTVFRDFSKGYHTFGAGDALRVRFAPWLIAKASYEYATRLPSAFEVFGNGVLVRPNMELEPERSHNFNLGPRLELRRTPIGDITTDVNFFFREGENLIARLITDKYITYQNIYRARTIGIENAAYWELPGRWLRLDGSFTLQDKRNVSDDGPFRAFNGDRIPDLQWMFGSWGAELRFRNIVTNTDRIEPFYTGRYVHEFYRGWESQGNPAYKQSVPKQITHNVGISYILRGGPATVTTTFEVQNVADERVYDVFGLQRPGRSFYLKMTGEI